MSSENVLLSGQRKCQSALLFIVSGSATAMLRNAITGGLSAAAYLRAVFLCGLLPETWSSWDVGFVECERDESGP